MIASLATILAATDFSAHGDAAIPYAYALADRGATVHLLHVIEPVTVPSPLYAHYTPGAVPTEEQRALQIADLEARLRGLVPPEAASKGVRSAFAVVEGDIVSRVVGEVAARLGADAICVGSHGRGGVLRLLLGSTAEAILRSSSGPVLIVRPRA